MPRCAGGDVLEPVDVDGDGSGHAFSLPEAAAKRTALSAAVRGRAARAPAPGGQAGELQLKNARLGGIFNMGGTAVANYVSILERIK